MENPQKISKAEYHRNYYLTHKETLMKKLCAKVQCELCGRCVIQNNLKSHQKKPICINVQTENQYKEARKSLKLV